MSLILQLVFSPFVYHGQNIVKIVEYVTCMVYHEYLGGLGEVLRDTYLFFYLFIYSFGHHQVSALPLVGWPTSSLSITTWSSLGRSITSSLPLHGRSRGPNVIMNLTPQTVGRPTGTPIKRTLTGPITPALQCHPHSNILSIYLLTNIVLSLKKMQRAKFTSIYSKNYFGMTLRLFIVQCIFLSKGAKPKKKKKRRSQWASIANI